MNHLRMGAVAVLAAGIMVTPFADAADLRTVSVPADHLLAPQNGKPLWEIYYNCSQSYSKVLPKHGGGISKSMNALMDAQAVYGTDAGLSLSEATQFVNTQPKNLALSVEQCITLPTPAK